MSQEYRNPAYKAAGIALRELIRDHGTEVLGDLTALEAKLKEKQCQDAVIYQLLLLLQAGNVQRYIPQVKTGISMIDINNIVTVAEQETGLSKSAITALLSALLYGLSLPTTIESVVIPTDGHDYARRDLAFADYADYVRELQLLEQAVEQKAEGRVAEHAKALDTMARAGHPEALYLKGVCYEEGIATEPDTGKALHYFKAAAENGSNRANARLGDHYFEATVPHYTKAFSYYTVIGATALSPERRDNLKAILGQKNSNVFVMAFAAVLLALLTALNIAMGSGAFSADDAPHWVCAVISMVLNFGVFGVGVWSFIAAKYNSLKWIAPAMIVPFALLALIAL